MKNLLKKTAFVAVSLGGSTAVFAADAASGIDFAAIANSVDFSKVLAAMGIIITASFGLLVALKGVSFLIAALRK